MIVPASAPPGAPIHSRLDPLVDRLLRLGHRNDGGVRWRNSPDGFLCRLVGSMDWMPAILGEFQLPRSVFVEPGGIFDAGSRSQMFVARR